MVWLFMLCGVAALIFFAIVEVKEERGHNLW